MDNDHYLSSSPSITEEEIDFQYVYALRTFIATEQGQANVHKGDAMVLLNDSNSYWWLVRLVHDSSVGFLPAEHVETPSERLARLNKHRNCDISSPASFSYTALFNKSTPPDSDSEDENTTSRNPNSRLKRFRSRKAPRSTKSVTFTPTLTYVSASEYEITDNDTMDYEFEEFEESEEELEEEEEDLAVKATVEQQDNDTNVEPDSLVTHTLRSNGEESSSTNTTNSNEDDDSQTDNQAEENAKKTIDETNDSKSSNGLFSLISGNNHKQNYITNTTLKTSTSNETQNLIEHPTEPTDSPTIKKVTPLDSEAPTEKTVKRRSLLTTRSSTEQLKQKPTTSQISSTNTSSNLSGLSGLFKRISRKDSLKNKEQTGNTLKGEETNSIRESVYSSSDSITSTSSLSSSTSPELSDRSQSTKIDSSLSKSKLSQSITTLPEKVEQSSLDQNAVLAHRASMFEPRNNVTAAFKSDALSQRRASDGFSTSNPGNSTLSEKSIFNSTSIPDITNEESKAQHIQEQSQASINSTHLSPLGNNSDAINRMIPERSANRTSPMLKDSSFDSPVTTLSMGTEHYVNHVESNSRFPNHETGADSVMTASSNLSSPALVDDRDDSSCSPTDLTDTIEDVIKTKIPNTDSAGSVGYLSSLLDSSKIHPDIVPIFRETSFRLDQMNDVSIFPQI